MNRLKTDFLFKISEYFNELPFSVKDKGICCCLSGGADSVSLLLALHKIKDKYGFRLYACHFNHMIRGEEADRDEQFCRNLCKKYSIELFLGRDNVPAYAIHNKKSLEEAARECRYSFFERICSKNSVDYCATAHNKNDDVETFLMNIFRGSGSNGGSSIALYTNNLLRPMLMIERVEVEEFLSEFCQDFVYDSTNSSFEHTRNYVRNVLLPEIKSINPKVIDTISRYIESNREDRKYFEAIVEENLNVDLRTLDSAVRKRVIIRKYKDFCGNSLNRDLLLMIDNALFTNNRKVLDIYSHHEAIIDSGKVSFFHKSSLDEHKQESVSLNLGTNSTFDESVEIHISENRFDCENIYNLYKSDAIDYDNIVGGIFARTRQIGDKIVINGVNKSLKKLFIDKKIPKEYRNIIPIFCDEKGIIYVPFVGPSDRVNPKNANMLLYIKTIFNSIDKERWMSVDEK